MSRGPSIRLFASSRFGRGLQIMRHNFSCHVAVPSSLGSVVNGGGWGTTDSSRKLLFRCPDSLSLSLIRHRLTFLPPVAPWRGWQAGGRGAGCRSAYPWRPTDPWSPRLSLPVMLVPPPPPLTYSWNSGEATPSFYYSSE